MVAALSKFHVYIHQLRHVALQVLHQEPMVVLEDSAAFHTVRDDSTSRKRRIENSISLPIVLLLHRSQLDINDGLFLRGNVLSHVFLHTAQ